MDSIIFDLDGTLWDSRKEVCDVWNKTLKEFNIDRAPIVLDDLSKTMGMVVSDIVDMLLGDIGEETKKAFMKTCSERESEHLSTNGATLYEGLEETLIKLSQKYDLYIVSNCQDGYIEAFYKYYNTQKYFKDCECPGRTGLGKAENIKLIIERNNLKDPIYVGDTQGDCNAAKKAGVPFVHAKYGYGKNIEGLDYEIETISDIVGLVERI